MKNIEWLPGHMPKFRAASIRACFSLSGFYGLSANNTFLIGERLISTRNTGYLLSRVWPIIFLAYRAHFRIYSGFISHRPSGMGARPAAINLTSRFIFAEYLATGRAFSIYFLNKPGFVIFPTELVKHRFQKIRLAHFKNMLDGHGRYTHIRVIPSVLDGYRYVKILTKGGRQSLVARQGELFAGNCYSCLIPATIVANKRSKGDRMTEYFSNVKRYYFALAAIEKAGYIGNALGGNSMESSPRMPFAASVISIVGILNWPGKWLKPIPLFSQPTNLYLGMVA